MTAKTTASSKENIEGVRSRATSTAEREAFRAYLGPGAAVLGLNGARDNYARTEMRYGSFDAISQEPHWRKYIGQYGAKRLSAPYDAAKGRTVLCDDRHCIRSTDRDFNKFMMTLQAELDSSFKPENKDGFVLGLAGSDFSRLRTVAGTKMSPMSLPTGTNMQALADSEIVPFPAKPEHEVIVRAITRLVFKHRPVVPVEISRISSSTVPFFSSAVPVKKKILEIASRNIPDMLRLCADRDHDELFKRYGISFDMCLVQRLQADGGKQSESGLWLPKNREVYNLAGERVAADKRTPLEPLGLDGWTCRVRTAWASPGATSYVTSCLRACYRGYLDEFAFTWKHRSAADIYQKLERAELVLGIDAHQMDQTLQPNLIGVMLDEMQKSLGFNPGALEFLSSQYTCGYFSPDAGEGACAMMPGSPRWLNYYGLTSGMGQNPDMGKGGMMGIYSCLLFDAIGPEALGHVLGVSNWRDIDQVERALAPQLRGERAIGHLNMSDDELMFFLPETVELGKRVQKALETGTYTKYVKLELESAAAFSGQLLYGSVQNGRVKLQEVAPNPVTFLSNFLVPERDFGGAMRPFAGRGRQLAIEHYSTNSRIRDIRLLANDVWRRTMREYPGMEAIIERHAKLFPVKDRGLREVDILALNDPGKIHAYIDLDDLQPNVREQLTVRIDDETVQRVIKGFCH